MNRITNSSSRLQMFFEILGMRNFQDNFEKRKQSFNSAFQLHDCNFNINIFYELDLGLFLNKNSIEHSQHIEVTNSELHI